VVRLVQHKDKAVRNTASWLLAVIAADVSVASELSKLGYDVYWCIFTVISEVFALLGSC